MALRRTPKPDPDITYRAWQGFAADHPDPGTVVAAGTLLTGDHPIVRAHAANFLPASTPTEEVDRLVHASRFGGEAA